jgi:hypothetical protein
MDTPLKLLTKFFCLKSNEHFVHYFAAIRIILYLFVPGMVASLTTLPVIGVPIWTKSLQGMDSLLSIVQVSV